MELPRKCRFTLIPVIAILVIPFYVFTPTFQQAQILRLINETVALIRNQSLYGA